MSFISVPLLPNITTTTDQQLSDTRRLEVQWRTDIGLKAQPAQPRQAALLPSCEFLSPPSLQSCEAPCTAGLEILEIRSYWHTWYVPKQALTDLLCRREITFPAGLKQWSTLPQICKTGGGFFGVFWGVLFVFFQLIYCSGYSSGWNSGLLKLYCLLNAAQQSTFPS